MRRPLLSGWPMMFKRLQKIKLTAYHYCPWFSLRGGNKSLSQKTPCISETGPRGPCTGPDLMTWKPLLWRLGFILPEDVTQAPKGGKPATTQSCCDTYEPQQQPEWHNHPMGAEVVHTPTLVLTNNSLAGFKTCSTGGQTCLGQEK